MRKTISKIISGISIIVLILAIIVLVSAVFTKSGDIPEIGGYSVMRVMTGSMEPEIPTDSVILIDRLDDGSDDRLAELKVGDVISFYSSNEELNGAPTTHRIVEINETDGELVFTTKGDANALADKETCYSGMVIGKVVWSSHGLGVVVNALLNPVIFFPLIIFPLLVMIIVNLVQAVKRGKEIAIEEEEQAVREAIAEIRRRKEREAEEISDCHPDENTDNAATERGTSVDDEKTEREEV